MPRLFHRPPKYSLHKGSKQAIVYLNGVATYLGAYGSEKSHQRYQEILQQWHALRHQGPQPKSKQSQDQQFLDAITPVTLRLKWRQGLKVSLDELILVYKRHANQYYVKNGKITREAEMIKEITTHLGKMHGLDKVDDFGPVELDNFRDTLIDDFDWSRKYINKQIVRIIAMFKWAVKKEICSANVHAQLMALGGLKKGRTKARETLGVRCVEDSLVKKTLPKLPDIVADMVRFQRLTGARPGEVCSIRPCDIDRSQKIWLYRPGAHKTEHLEKDRIVPIGPQAQQILRPYLLRNTESYCFSARESVERARRQAEGNRKTPKSCGNTRGSNRVSSPNRSAADRYAVASYRNAIRRACNKLAILVWTPNQLRHTAATDIRKQFGLEAAQVVCGHATADVTQVYAERDLKLAMKVAEAVG